MARTARQVGSALDRWVGKGLLDAAGAEDLRREAELHHLESTRRLGQILVASLGAVALILAAVLFAQRNWPNLSEAARTVVLLAAGLVVYLLGLRVRRRLAWRYSGVLLQAGGWGVLISGIAYSYNAWADGSPAAVAMGVLSLAIPVATAPVSFREGVLMTGVHAAAAYGFVGLFFGRTFGMSYDQVVWWLDGVTALAVVGLPVVIRTRGGEVADRALAAFAVSVWGGLVLVSMTGAGPLEMQENTVWPMDVWLLLIAGVTLWAIHLGPATLRRAEYEANLAVCVVVGGFLAMATANGPLGLGTGSLAAFGAGVGVAGMAYGLGQRSAGVLLTGALMMLLNTWIFAIDNAGAMGGVVALLVSAAILFWVSTRIRAALPPPADRAA